MTVPANAFATVNVATTDAGEVHEVDRLKADETLDWDAPEGSWMIVRIGYVPIGRLNALSAREFAGLECNTTCRGLLRH